jgi:protease stability complex PrcB-like protein
VIAVVSMLLVAVTLQGGSPAIRSLARGDQSNIDDTRQAVARTEAEFTALWRQHAPDRPAPTVNFPSEMVVGVFLGSRPTAGFAVTIVGTREQNGALVVQYRETRPARGLVTAQVITSAYHIAALPARAGDVKFERIE